METSISGGLDSLPYGGLFEFACVIVFSEFIFWLSPSKAVIPEPSKSSIRNWDHKNSSSVKEQVRNTVIDNQSLTQWREWLGDNESPEQASSIDRACHHEIWHAPGLHDIAKSWIVYDDGEGWSLINSVDLLVTTRSHYGTQRMEGSEGGCSLRGHYKCVFSLYLKS